MSQNIAEVISNMIDHLQESLDDAEKFDRGNAAAGTRVRKSLQDIATSCKTARTAVIDIRNERKASE